MVIRFSPVTIQGLTKDGFKIECGNDGGEDIAAIFAQSRCIGFNGGKDDDADVSAKAA